MDKRANNGGNSTKAKSLNDKRLNLAKQLLQEYLDKEFDYTKLNKIMNKLYTDGMNGDMKAATLFLSYALGKPKETKDIQLTVEKNFPDWLNESES